jgi:hypothetical protein
LTRQATTTRTRGSLKGIWKGSNIDESLLAESKKSLFSYEPTKKLEVAMEQAALEDYVKIPKQEYNLLKEVYRTVKRQAFLVRIDEAERNLAAGKTKSMTVDDFIASA